MNIPPCINTRVLQLAVLGLLDADEGLGKWSVQGLGVLRLYIRGLGRLHLWDRVLRYPNVSMVHTHSWDLRSTVVLGRLRNQRFIESTAGKPYHKQRLVTGYQTALVTKPNPVHLLACPGEIYYPGDIYRQHKDEIHISIPDDGCITLMERREDGHGEADVYWPEGCTWGTAQPRAANSQELRPVFERARAGLVAAIEGTL